MSIPPIVGTDADDLLKLNLGRYDVTGGEGNDTLELDWSNLTVGMRGSVSGSLNAGYDGDFAWRDDLNPLHLGTSWTETSPAAAFSPRDTGDPFIFDNSLWISNGYHIGGSYSQDLWRSDDGGQNWQLVNANTPYEVYSRVEVLGDYMYAMRHSVWRSQDGVNWEEIADSTPFANANDMFEMRATVFHDRLWVVDPTAVWSSADGVEWTKEADLPFDPRLDFALTVFNDRLVLAGGFTPSPNNPPESGYANFTTFNDVWSSADGETWDLVTPHADWAPRQWLNVKEVDGLLYMFGGYSNVENRNLNDMWVSRDGITWTQIDPDDIWSGRHWSSVYVVGNQIVLAGGNDSVPGASEVRNDVWTYTDNGELSSATFTGIENFHITLGSGEDNVQVGDGTDFLDGGAGNDVLHAGGGGDTIIGGAGDDALYGELGNDQITGNAGNDLLDGGAGADTMAGGTGDDAYIVDDAGDVVVENFGEGTDEIRTDLASYSIAALDNVENLTGTSTFGQSLTGNGQDNVITGHVADDILDGGAGDDLLDGGAGADRMSGGTGDDIYIVDNAGDVVIENPGEGMDEIRTALASYSMAAVGNVENLSGTSTGGQTLTGNDQANVIAGNTGDDILNGGAGDDRLDGGAGADTMAGGIGDDVYIVDDAGDVVIENTGEGTDEIRTNLASYSIAALGNVENLTGTAMLSQTLTGNGDDNVIRGYVGADTLNGDAGDDLLDGGAGADTMVGGAGDDIYIVDNMGDVVIENAGEGTDEIRTILASYSIAALDNVEHLTGTSTSGQTLTGNSQANVITGNVGNDLLDGGAGADAMVGGAGNDIYIVDDAGDVVIENAGEGTDEIRTILASYSIAALDNIENLTGTSTTGQTLTGNSQANVITGNAGADLLAGGAGADTMIGGAGDDVYIVDDAGDVVVENPGGGVDEISTNLASCSIAAFDNVENLTGTSTAGQALTGNDQANVITGNAGDDLLDGGLGADTLAGGTGDDVYVVDNVGDVVLESPNEGTDEIRTGLASYSIAALDNVENLTGTSTSGQALTGNSHENIITGNIGDDLLNGGAGADTMVGGTGNDIFVVDDTGDIVVENVGEGMDEIRTGLASYSIAVLDNVENLTGTATTGQTLTGNSHDNVITGNVGSDFLDGGAGNDLLDGRAGADNMTGGTGDDIYIVDDTGDTVVENAGEGTDEIRTDLVSYSIAALANVENVTGTATTGQTLIGNSNANVITGNAGADLLDGGAGADTMVGGAGDDVYIVDNTGDVVVENPGGGTDEIRTNLASYSIAALANIENLTSTSTNGQTLIGNSDDNVITGNVGADLLDGGAGADTMVGGAGNDVYIVDNTGDVVVEKPGGGTDEIRTNLASYSLAALANIENLTGTSTSGQTLIGNSHDNVITGDVGADLLDGGAGADTMIGGAGNDVYIVDNVGDVVIEHAGEGTDEIRTNLASYSIAALINVENLTGTSTGDQTLTGNSHDNVITANFGTNMLDGGDGWDVASFSGLQSDYHIYRGLDGLVRVEGAGVLDTLTHIEQIRFGNGQTIAISDSITKSDFDAPLLWTTQTPIAGEHWYVGDFDGDLKTDILRYVPGQSGADMYLSNGTSFTAAGSWTGAGYGAVGWQVGDFNGDGKDDIFRYVPGQSGADMFVSTGSGFVRAGSWTQATNGADGWHIGDFNGDGKDDIFRYVPGQSGADMFLSNGTNFDAVGSWTGAGYGTDGWHIGDFDGDGKDDIFRYLPGQSGADMFLSNGSGFVHDGSWTQATSGTDGWHVGDFNADGKDDIFRYLPGQSGADVFLSTGSGFVHDSSWTGAGFGNDHWYVGDFNGDGSSDLLRIGSIGTEVLL